MAKRYHHAWLIVVALGIALGPSSAAFSIQSVNNQELPWTTKRFDDGDLPCLPVEEQKNFSVENLTSADNTYLMMAASYLAYSFWPGKRQRILSAWGFNSIHIFDETSSSSNGYWAEHNDFILIAFRGTQEPQDLVTDVSVSLEPAFKNEGQSILIHSGFNAAARSVWKHVLNAALHAKTKKKPLFLTGHSLGGAVALLSALELELTTNKVASIWTFGAPKVGNTDFFAWATHKLQQRWHKIDEESDPIPALPFTEDDHSLAKQWAEKFGHIVPLFKTLASHSQYSLHATNSKGADGLKHKVISKRSIKEIARGFWNHLPRSYLCRLSKTSKRS